MSDATVSTKTVSNDPTTVYTEVRNLATNATKSINQPPKEAVVVAFEQERGNYHTWMYTPFDKHPDAFEKKSSVICGDWYARK